jgi:hypothetical protein
LLEGELGPASSRRKTTPSLMRIIALLHGRVPKNLSEREKKTKKVLRTPCLS